MLSLDSILFLYTQHFIVFSVISIFLIVFVAYSCLKQISSIWRFKRSYKATLNAILYLSRAKGAKRTDKKQQQAS